MAVSVVCDTCGKRLNVKEESIGKKVRCPACKNPFTASVDGAIRVKKAVKEKEAKVSISWGFVSMIGLGVGFVLLIVLIIFGPVRAKHQWDPMAEKAENDVRDVVERGFQVYMVREGPMSTLLLPGAGAGSGGQVYHVQLLWDMFVMGLPEKIRFRGTTSEGEYTGTYNTKTFEVEADLEIGGRVVPGLDYAHKHGDTKVHVNGWNRDGEFKVWYDGKPAEFPQPKTRPSRAIRNRSVTAPATVAPK